MINTASVIHLTPAQEQYLIRYVIQHEDLFIDAGASRAVFQCTTDIADYLNLPNKDCHAYIMKIAMGRGGVEQTKTEFETYLNRGDSGVLADILAIGRYVEIMEAVEVRDFRDEACRDFTADDFMEAFDDLSSEDAIEIEHTIDVLDDLLGYTSDNGQIGKTRNGHWVAYDYGYIPGKGINTQTSDVRDVIYRDSARKEYLTGLIDLLENEEDFMGKWEETFLGYDDEEAENQNEEKDCSLTD